MSLWRTIGIVCSPITVVVHVKGGSEGQFVSDPIPQLCDLLDESRRRSGTRPWPTAQGKVSVTASASLFHPTSRRASSRLVVVKSRTRRPANAFFIFPPVEQTPIRLAPPKGASPGAPSQRQRRLLEAISGLSQELPPPP